MNSIRVLQILTEPFENGGQELLICNLYRNINREKVQFDFIVPYTGKNENLRNEIIDNGGKFYAINIDFNKNKLFNRINFFSKLKALLKENEYDIVHINSVSLLGLTLGTLISKMAKIKHIIVHSHNDGADNFKYRITKKITDKILLKYPDYYFACSNRAAEWKFPKQIIENKKYTVIKNGINVEKFRFNEQISKKYKEELNLKDKIVIGHVGRFEKQKNHEFIIEVFEEVLKLKQNACLILIGEGSLKKDIEESVIRKKIEDNVMFLNIRDDVQNLLCAMDCFLFPSIYEGLGIAVIEAQNSGLPVICSDKLVKEVEITSNIKKINLNTDKKEWAKIIIEQIEANKNQDRTLQSKIVRKAGYDIKSVAEDLTNFYIGLK